MYFCKGDQSKKEMKTLLTLFLFLCSFFLVAQTPDYMGWVSQSADYIEANKLDSAAYALQRAMAMEPANEHNPVLLLNLGILQRQLGLLDDAYISFTASLGNNPMPEVVLHHRASLLCDMDRFDEAMEDYDAIIRHHPDDVEAYYRRGLLFLDKSNRTSAEADFNSAKEIDPDNMYTKLCESLLFKLDDNWEAAGEIYTHLLETAQDPNPIFYMNRAECYLNTDRLSRAAADLQAAWSSQKDNPYFYILRGRLRLEQFDKLAARGDFLQAKKMGYDATIAKEWIKRTK
jgi:tetratricopeptide (TPR) repeat protein